MDKMLGTGFLLRTTAARILQALEKGRAGCGLQLGARNERCNIEVVESLLDALGKPRSLIRFVKDRLGHDRRYAIDPSLAETSWLAAKRNLGKRFAKNHRVVSAKFSVGRAGAQWRLP